MAIKIFSKRHKDGVDIIELTESVRKRIWFLIEESDSRNIEYSMSDWNLSFFELPDRLRKQYGWDYLHVPTDENGTESVSIEHFILRASTAFVMDAIELYHDLIEKYPNNSTKTLYQFQNELNEIFEDANLPWRLVEGRILRFDSKWLDELILAKASELLSHSGFNGASREFLEARSDLSSGDTKGAINCANLALESAMKAIVGEQDIKPGALLKKVIDSGLVPEYHAGFMEAFEQHILRSIPVMRNTERGVAHGQGLEENTPPESLAELAVNLTGVLIIYLLKRYLELNPPEEETEEQQTDDDDGLPF